MGQDGAMPQPWDLAVVGLGAMGSATLWRAASRGLRAVGVDRFAPPHDRGSTHGGSRIIRTAYFEDPAYLPLLREAFPLWRELERESGANLLTMTDAAMIGPRDSALIRGSLRTAQVHGLPHELLDAERARRRFPQFALGDGDVVFHEEGGGVLRPEACVRAALDVAKRRGAEVRIGTRVESIEPHAESALVHVEGGAVVEARRVVVCAGAWTSRLLPALPVALRVERQVTAWFAPRDPALHAPERCPVFIRELSGDHLVYGVPAIDGEGVKLAVHHEGAPADPDGVAREITAADLAPLREHALHCMHGLEPEPLRAVTCLYTNTPDEHFVVDTLPATPQITVVSACSGHGFKFAAIIGDVAVDLATGGTRRPIEAFSLRRFTANA
jgi:sarcosine oxidase